MLKEKNILVVDDDERSRDLLQYMMRSFGHHAKLAKNGMEGLALLSEETDLVILDILMPEMDGLEMARRIRKSPMAKDVPILMVTGLASDEDRISAAEAGANDFINKPVQTTELRVRTDSLLKMKEAQDALKKRGERLEKMVRERTGHLEKTVQALQVAQRMAQQACIDTIQCLAMAAEYKDTDTGNHVHRIGAYSAILAKAMNLDPKKVETVYHAASIHDVGKIGIPDAILLKPGKLTFEEFEIMKEHTLIGGRILSGFDSELLRAGKEVAFFHHEKWDGSGYPNGLSGKKIPLFARICAVADVFDALTSKRPYKEAFSNKKAYGIIRDGRGNHFDPQVVDCFFAHQGQIESVQRQYAAAQA